MLDRSQLQQRIDCPSCRQRVVVIVPGESPLPQPEPRDNIETPPPSKMGIFLLAALTTYIPWAAYAGFAVLTKPRMPSAYHEAYYGVGIIVMLIYVGPFCSLVTGIVAAILGGHRRIHEGWMVFYLLVGWSLALAVIHVLN